MGEVALCGAGELGGLGWGFAAGGERRDEVKAELLDVAAVVLEAIFVPDAF